MVERRIRKTATTFTIGNWLARLMWSKIQSGIVSCVPAVNVVTITSSKDRANAQAAGDQGRPDHGERDVTKCLERVSAQVHGRLLDRPRCPTQPRDHVVEDNDDAE